MADELKPCPFCGDDKPYVDVGTVECGTCGALAFGPHSVPADRTGHNWQTRPIEYSLLARAEAAEEKVEKVNQYAVECQDASECTLPGMTEMARMVFTQVAADLNAILAPDTSGDGK